MSDQKTKDKILEAASEIFCDKGFKSATIREICRKADVNVAAVNYHFGDKRRLFIQVLTMWINETGKFTLFQDESCKDLSAEEKLKIYIRNELLPLCTYDDPQKTIKRRIRILFQEYVSEECDPELFKCHESTEEKIISPVIRDLLHPIEDENIIRQACLAASGVLVHHFLMIIHHPEGEIESEEQLEFMTDFYTTTIFGSLEAVKRKYTD